MVMPSEHRSNVGPFQLVKERRSPHQRDVEVLVRLIFMRQKQRVMLKQQNMFCVGGLGIGKPLVKPSLLSGQ